MLQSSEFRLYLEDVVCKYRFETCAVITEQVILELVRLGFVEKDD